MDFDTFIATNMDDKIKIIKFKSLNILIYFTYYNDKFYYNYDHIENERNEHEINVFSSIPNGIFLNYEIILSTLHIHHPNPISCLHVYNYLKEKNKII